MLALLWQEAGMTHIMEAVMEPFMLQVLPKMALLKGNSGIVFDTLIYVVDKQVISA